MMAMRKNSERKSGLNVNILVNHNLSDKIIPVAPPTIPVVLKKCAVKEIKLTTS